MLTSESGIYSTALLRRQPPSNSVAGGAADLSRNPPSKAYRRLPLRSDCHALPIWQSSTGRTSFDWGRYNDDGSDAGLVKASLGLL